MPTYLIGKSTLGDLGLCLNSSEMGNDFIPQLEKIKQKIPNNLKFAITSITGSREVSATNGEYLPKIREYDPKLHDIFDPEVVYNYVQKGLDSVRPGADFILWKDSNICCLTFSREAPIISFESSSGQKALGVILRFSLLKHGDYLFQTIKNAMEGDIKVTLLVCNHYEYSEGKITDFVQNLALEYNMAFLSCCDSQKEPECYKRDEKGHHVIAMW